MRTREWLRVRGEAVLWAVPASVVGAFAFRWFGIAIGAAVALLHVLVARRDATAPRAVPAMWHVIALPSIAGTVFAGAPLEISIVVAPLLALIWRATRVPERLRFAGSARLARLGGVLAFVLTLIVCSRLPLKALDESVGPATYRGLTLAEVCTRLGEDLHVRVQVHSAAAARVVDFTVPRGTSKRAVLEKLARETGLCLEVGFCGTGASILWGSYPMMAHLVDDRGTP